MYQCVRGLSNLTHSSFWCQIHNSSYSLNVKINSELAWDELSLSLSFIKSQVNESGIWPTRHTTSGILSVYVNHFVMITSHSLQFSSFSRLSAWPHPPLNNHTWTHSPHQPQQVNPMCRGQILIIWLFFFFFFLYSDPLASVSGNPPLLTVT